ncbi:hypothetical protein IQ258_10840 [Coleofasciculus sp. LEGE 07081]|nr:hypothetical protein [Coleofasciculus sp. LEGE 07081]
MRSTWVKIILLGLLLMAILAPFAGLAPLMLVLLIAGVGSILWSLLQVLVFGETDEDESGVQKGS